MLRVDSLPGAGSEPYPERQRRSCASTRSTKRPVANDITSSVNARTRSAL